MTEKRTGSSSSKFCEFPFSDGRRCRMLRAPDHPTLCLFHARDEQELRVAREFGAHLAASLTGDYLTAADINHVLSKVFTALAQKRISQRDAATLAYLGQLLLYSVPKVYKETGVAYSTKTWHNLIDNAIRLPDSWPETPASDTDSAPTSPENKP